MLECAGSLFTVKGSVIKSAGWRAVFSEKEDGEDNATLPAMQDGEWLPLSGIELVGETYQAQTVTHGKQFAFFDGNGRRKLKNADLKASMKDTGIGTPATRAAIIETLFSPVSISSGRKRTLSRPKGDLPFTTSSGTRR